MNNISDLLAKANNLFAGNNMGEALALYQKIIEIDPLNILVLNNLGMISLIENRFGEAISWIARVLEIDPKNMLANANMGFILTQLKKPEEALGYYQAALKTEPCRAYLWHDMGNAFYDLQDFEKAAECYKQAVKLDGGFINSYMKLGEITKKQKKYSDAVLYYKKVLALDYDSLEVWMSLALIECERENYFKAINYLGKALALDPDNSQAYVIFATIAFRQKKYQEAIFLYEKGLDLAPDCAEALMGIIGIYHQKMSDIDKTSYYLKQLLSIKPGDPWALRILTEVLHIKKQVYDGFKLQSEIIHVHHCAGYNPRVADFYQKIPLWQGDFFTGKDLVIGDNQGFSGYGDIIQFVRYLPLVKEYGGNITLPIPKGLLRLFKNFKGIDEPVLLERKDVYLRKFDLSIPLIALPVIFNVSPTSILNKVPYIPICPELDHIWKSRVNFDDTLKVGLVWAGSKEKGAKTCPFKNLMPLKNIKGVTYYSLQIGVMAKEYLQVNQGFDIVDLTDEIEDFADTAALINNLDLIISIDTSVAHLSGAMAKPTWLMLPFSAEWRWALEQNSSPWYPTMRIFRCKVHDDWSGLIEEICVNLERLIVSGKKLRMD